ncbi:hypothetical protein BLNAU_11660 [Blattamonas nauphoetae]|uniref:Uncharacterized protein n=1 Tax=Blattamonas nauphoetae TaxID=2049346 RepID=A0ABQ9XPE2_9EUKA|nr:hypothetical protein BLNAU_11660 [Blattamonas nauphoetae]
MSPTHCHILQLYVIFDHPHSNHSILGLSSSSANPNLIDSFIKRIAISPSLSNTLFRHDRNLSLITTLSQSSSPLFAKLKEPLLDPTFPLHSLLSTRSFTNSVSSFIRMASTNPAFFRRIVETLVSPILNIALLAAVMTVRVVSEDPSEPRCLNFGRATSNLVVLLKTIAYLKLDLAQNSDEFNSLPPSLLSLIILSAASTNDELSTVAVSVFSIQLGLFTPHTEALLFATPLAFPLSDAFTPRHPHVSEDLDHMKCPSQSICAEVGRCILSQPHSDVFSAPNFIDFAIKLQIRFAGCLVNALHSTTTLPHSFTFFAPELCELSQQTSVWNDTSRPSALTALTRLAGTEISFAYRVNPSQLKLNEADDERRDTIFVHLFPFFRAESQTRFLSSFNTFHRSKENQIHKSLDRVVECLVEMATVKSYNTPIALLTEMKQVARFLCFINPETHSVDRSPKHTSSLERSIVEKLNTAECEERWTLLTQLAIVSRDDPDLTNELVKAENDAQALLVLSVPSIRSTLRPRFHLDKNPAAFDRLVELACRLDNHPLVATALAHIADTFEELTLPPLAVRLYQIQPQPELCELVYRILPAIARLRRDGVDDGCVVGKDEMTSLIVVSLTTDLTPLRSILLVLQQIEERTRNTPTPFSLSTVTPRPSADSHSTKVPHQAVQVLNEVLVFDIAKEAAETVCLVLKERRTSFSRTRTHNDSISINETLCIPTSTFLPLAPLFAQILKTVVPLTTDRTEIRSKQNDLSRLLNVLFSLFKSLIHSATPSSLSTPPLSSLLSILSIALVRLDRIPSSVNLQDIFCTLFEPIVDGSNPQMRKIVDALCEEGMEDRSDLAVDSFSFLFLNEWKGAHAQRPVIRVPLNPFIQRGPPMAGINGPRGAIPRPVIHPPNIPPPLLIPPQPLIPPRGVDGRPLLLPLNHPPPPHIPPLGVFRHPFGDCGGQSFPRPPVGMFPRPRFDGDDDDVFPFGPGNAQPPVRPGIDAQPAPTDLDQTTP